MARFYSTGQVARMLGMDRKTVWRRIMSGDIPAFQVADGGEWRIPADYVKDTLGDLAETPAERRRKRERWIGWTHEAYVTPGDDSAVDQADGE